MEFLHPNGWKPAKGYANGVVAQGRMVFLGGQIGWNEEQQFESDHFIDQFRQTLRNITVLLAEAGGGPQHLVRLTWYITDRDAYLNSQKEMGAVYREVIGRHFPPMAVVQVVKLVEERALIEIEATAVLPA